MAEGRAEPGENSDTAVALSDSSDSSDGDRDSLGLHTDVNESIVEDESPTVTMMSGVGAGSDTRTAAARASLQPGDHLGRYIIIDVLGAGGVGEVYSAYDPELARRVAVKVLRAKSFSEEGTARLQREAQAMARVKSNSVAAVYDVGVTNGKPFVAMEFVDGVTLKTWLKAEERPWREILELFKQAGRGLEAAHARGIVHRDFKPGNVMVDSEGRARVLDFGLARAAGELEDLQSDESTAAHGDTEASNFISASNMSLLTELTQAGRVMGTPKYMAPEQFLGHGVDARTDQFSFCVVLYTALYGEAPFAGHSPAALSRSVLRGKIRDKPKRMGATAWIRPILLRGLSRHQDDRYPSMRALLAALSRDPAARRRRLAAILAVLALAGVTAALLMQRFSQTAAASCQGIESGLVGVWDPARRDAVRGSFQNAAKARPERGAFAGATFELVSERLDAYSTAWVSSRRDVCQATLVHGTQTNDAMDLRMGCLDRKLRQLGALTSVFSSSLDLKAVQASVAAVGSLSLLSECDDLEGLAAAVALPADEARRRQVQELRSELATVRALDMVAKYSDAGDKARATLTRARALDYPPLEAEALYEIGRSEERLGKYAESKISLEASILLADQVGHDEIRARALSELIIVVGYWLHSFEAAKKVAAQARAVMTRVAAGGELLGPYHRHLGVVLFTAGKHQEARKHYKQALGAFEEAFGARHPMVANTYNGLAAVYWGQGKLPEALHHYQKAQRIWAGSLGMEHPRVAMTTHNIGLISMSKGDHAAAVESLQRSLGTIEETLGKDHATVGRIANNLGLALRGARDYTRSRPHYQRALDIWERKLGPDHAWLVEPLVGLAWLDLRQGRASQARAQFERALLICRKESCEEGDDEPVSHLYYGLAKLLWQERAERPRALGLAREARVIFAKNAAVSASAKAYLSEADTWLEEHTASGAKP